jgi:hypothetical protein
MSLNPEFSVEEFQSEFLDLKKRYMDDRLLTTDFLATRKLRVKLQAFLNSQIT